MKRIMLVVGLLFALWSTSALVVAAIGAGGIVPLLSSYMSAIGLVAPIYTLVDFYTHIKGIEYLLCVAFFVAFPVFYKFVNKEQKTEKVIA